MKKMRKYSVLLLLCFLISAMMPVSASTAAKLNKKSITVNVKKTYTLKLTGASGKVKWSSSNKKIATVSSKGVVKGVKKGSCKITAKAGKKSYTCKVTVKQPVTSVKLNQKSVSLKAGKTVTLKATASPSTANTKTVTWSSSDTSIATVTSKGVVKGVGNGTATITATAKDGSGKKATCKVTVSGASTEVDISKYITTVTLDNSNINEYIGVKFGDEEKNAWGEYIGKYLKLTNNQYAKGFHLLGFSSDFAIQLELSYELLDGTKKSIDRTFTDDLFWAQFYFTSEELSNIKIDSIKLEVKRSAGSINYVRKEAVKSCRRNGGFECIHTLIDGKSYGVFAMEDCLA
jgi:hypothetical protein